MCRNNTR
jgi:hypothetical protein